MKNIILLGFLSMGILFTSCDSDNDDKDTQDYSALLINTGENVILRTYESLSLKGQELLDATALLESDQTPVNLEAARKSWVETRSPWEQSEGFLFGPVDQEGLDPSMDSWPVNVVDLNNLLSSNNELTIDFLAQQEGTLKGFHTVEFLLWGENGDKTIADFTPREFEYLAAASGALSDDAHALYDLWRPGSGNYINNLLTAGDGSIVYISQKSALEELTNAMIVIADEVANGKINDPLAQQDLTLEESRFSNNSKADFADNIRSIKNVYIGEFNGYGDGRSLSDVIDEKDAALNAVVLAELDEAINSIEIIPGTFTESVINNQASVEAAQVAVRKIQSTLESSVLPIISNL